MKLADCYRILGLRSGASFSQIKAAYRRLAREYHPDLNEGDQVAQDKFIAVTEAYKQLMEVVPPTDGDEPSTGSTEPQKPPEPAQPKVTVKKRQPPKVQVNPNLSEMDRQLKQTSYQQLQQLLKSRRFPRAIALVEGLAQRIPQDPEVRQWQAIAYQRWGRYLIESRQPEKARLYLKKALKTDPHNRSLWAEVEQDFRKLEKIF